MSPTVKKEAITGLDIGPDNITVAAKNAEYSTLAPQGAIEDGVITDKQKIAVAIKDLFRSKAISNKTVSMAVSGRGVVLRLMDVPDAGPGEIKDFIKYQVSKYIAFAGRNTVIDYYPFGREIKEGQNRLKILAAIVRKDIIDSYVETTALAGLILQAIDVAPIALARAVFNKAPLTGGILVLSAVEHDSPVIFIFKDNGLYYLHKVDQASGLADAAAAVEAYCRREFGENAEIKKISSTGMEDVSVARGLFLSDTKIPDFDIKLNLLPVEQIKIKEFNKQLLLLLKAICIVCGIMLSVFIFFNVRTYIAMQGAQALEKQIQMPIEGLDRLLYIENMEKVYNLELQIQSGIFKTVRDRSWANILQEIKKRIPKRAFLTSVINAEGNVVTFEGVAQDQGTIFDFQNSLKSSGAFGDVKVQQSQAAQSGDNMMVSFAISCSLAR